MDLPVHVAHLNLASGFRGGERQTLALIEALTGRVRQTAVVPRSSSLAARLSGGDVSIARVAGSPIIAVGATRGFDLLHVHEGRSAQTAALRFLLSKTPFVITRRIPQPPSAGALWCYRRAARVVAVSRDIEDGLRRLDDALPLTTVHDCVPRLEADHRATAAIRGDARLVIGHSGELHDAHKGQRLTIEIARRTATTHPGVRFLLIGRGRDEELLRREAAGLENIRFVGWTDRMADYYAAMDVMVYPSRYEGLGSAMLEAMSFGVPVVAADVGGIPEIVQQGVNGFLFAAGDADDFARRLQPLLDDDGLRERLGAAARVRAGQFSPESMASRYLAIYREISGADS